jgi:undecaprenyl-diphosphatase
LVGAFLGLAIFIHFDLGVTNADVWVTVHLQQHTALRPLMTAVSWLGYMPQSLLSSVAASALVLVLWGRWATLWFIVAIAGASVLTTAIKLIVARPRPAPPLVQILTKSSGYSFPSGHVMSYTVLFGYLVVYAVAIESSALKRILIIVPSLLMIVLVGPSRIYLGDHWTTDVIAAYLLAGAWLSVICTVSLSQRMRRLRTLPAARDTDDDGTSLKPAG